MPTPYTIICEDVSDEEDPFKSNGAVKEQQSCSSVSITDVGGDLQHVQPASKVTFIEDEISRKSSQSPNQSTVPEKPSCSSVSKADSDEDPQHLQSASEVTFTKEDKILRKSSQIPNLSTVPIIRLPKLKLPDTNTLLKPKYAIATSIDISTSSEPERDTEICTHAAISAKSKSDSVTLTGSVNTNKCDDSNEDTTDKWSIFILGKHTIMKYHKMKLTCHTMKIGVLKYCRTTSFLDIWLTNYAMEIAVPVESNAEKYATITLKPYDIIGIQVEPNIPVMFIYVTNQFGKDARQLLSMDKKIFDPSSVDQRKNKIIFIMKEITEKQYLFMCEHFPGKEKLFHFNEMIPKEIIRMSTDLNSTPKVLAVCNFCRKFTTCTKRCDSCGRTLYDVSFNEVGYDSIRHELSHRLVHQTSFRGGLSTNYIEDPRFQIHKKNQSAQQVFISDQSFSESITYLQRNIVHFVSWIRTLLPKVPSCDDAQSLGEDMLKRVEEEIAYQTEFAVNIFVQGESLKRQLCPTQQCISEVRSKGPVKERFKYTMENEERHCLLQLINICWGQWNKLIERTDKWRIKVRGDFHVNASEKKSEMVPNKEEDPSKSNGAVKNTVPDLSKFNDLNLCGQDWRQKSLLDTGNKRKGYRKRKGKDTGNKRKEQESKEYMKQNDLEDHSVESNIFMQDSIDPQKDDLNTWSDQKSTTHKMNIQEHTRSILEQDLAISSDEDNTQQTQTAVYSKQQDNSIHESSRKQSLRNSQVSLKADAYQERMANIIMEKSSNISSQNFKPTEQTEGKMCSTLKKRKSSQEKEEHLKDGKNTSKQTAPLESNIKKCRIVLQKNVTKTETGFEIILNLPHVKKCVLTESDLASLEGNNWLNDGIMDFYLNYVLFNKVQKEYTIRTHLFSVYFYTFLMLRFLGKTTTEIAKMEEYKKKHSWTSDVDIFAKDYIIIPANAESIHWSLFIVCNLPSFVIQRKEDIDTVPMSKSSQKCVSYTQANEIKEVKPCILIFDSLGSSFCNERSISSIRKFLEIEWELRKNSKKLFDKNVLPVKQLKYPLQTDENSCGLFVIHYLECFFKNPTEISALEGTEEDKYFGIEETFPYTKRKEIKDTFEDYLG